MTTFYYDPVLGVHHRLPAALAALPAFYAATQVPDDARRLFEAACASAGWAEGTITGLTPNRLPGAALLLAREWEMHDLAERLADAIEVSYEPTWDSSTGEFTWRLGLDEPHPRGQLNAFLAAAEAAGPGRWTALSAAPLEPCPKVVDVDFPNMALSRAEWIDGNLHLRLAPLREEPGRSTSFRVVGAETRVWDVTTRLDGVSVEVLSGSVIVRVPLVAGDLELGRGSY
jgi:hypothetical protein